MVEATATPLKSLDLNDKIMALVQTNMTPGHKNLNLQTILAYICT